MGNTPKTKAELLEEISILRSRMAELEKSNGKGQAACGAEEDRTGLVNKDGPAAAPVQEIKYRPSDTTGVEGATQETEAQFQVPLGNETVPMATLNPDLQLVKVTRAFCDLFGYTKQELKEWTIKDIIHPDDVEQAVNLATRVFKSGLPTFQLEKRFLTKSQSFIWCRVAAIAVHDGEGKPTLILVTLENITAHKGAEHELKRAHQQLEILKNNLMRRNESFVQALGEIVYDYNVSEDHIMWSGAYARLLGYSLEEMGTTRDHWLAKVHHDDHEAVVQAFALAQSEQRLFDIEYRVKSVAGNYIWMHDRGVLHFNQDGTLLQALGILVNITEQKRVELELRTRASQQEGVANLGTQALAGGLVLRLMEDASILIAGLLNAEYSQVLEYIPEDQTFYLRAGIGWDEGHVGSTTVDADPHVQPGYTLRTQDPVIVEDFHKETQFKREPLLEDHNLLSSISVTIPGPNQPFGVLGVYARTRLAFNQGDGHFLQGIANVLGESIARNKVEAELVEEGLTLHGIIEGSPAAIYVKDLQGRYFLSNQKHKGFWNSTQGEIEGKTDQNLFSPEIAAAIQADDQKVLMAGLPIESEEEIPQENGPRTFISNKFLLRNHQGTPYAICGISTDITERKRAETKEKASRNLLSALRHAQSRFIGDSSPQAVFENLLKELLSLTGSEYGFIGEIPRTGDGKPYLKTHAISNIAWNDEMRELYDRQAPNLDFYNLQTLFGTVITTGKPVIANRPAEDPRRGSLPQGHPPMNAFLGLPLYQGKNLVGMVGVANRLGGYNDAVVEYLSPFLSTCANIIEAYRNEQRRAQAESALRQAHDELEERVTQRTAELEIKNAELERFSYAVSHDLKSPLVTIQGFLKMLGEDARAGLTTRMDEDIKRIEGAAQKMQRLLNEVLELSRIGLIVNPPGPLAIGDVIREALKQVRGQITASRVHVDIEPELPVVWGDRPRLVDVIQNLVSNAVKFMGAQPEPRIEIGMRQEGEEAVMFVRDNGLGIEPRYHKNIFELFERLDAQAEGTGVGLALVKRIIEVQGGRIWVESEGHGRGSTFCFVLPLNEEMAPTPSTVQDTERA